MIAYYLKVTGKLASKQGVSTEKYGDVDEDDPSITIQES